MKPKDMTNKKRITSESESEEALARIFTETRRIETEEGRKVPLTKEDWIERIPSQIMNFFFEHELMELDISELEHLSKLSPSEVEKISILIEETEEEYSSYNPESTAAAISTALRERLKSLPPIHPDETQKKEQLLERLPAFVKELFSITWLETFSNEEIEELLEIPEDELKTVIESIADSRSIEGELEAEPKIESEIDEEDKPKIVTQDDLKAQLIAELKDEIVDTPKDETGE